MMQFMSFNNDHLLVPCGMIDVGIMFVFIWFPFIYSGVCSPTVGFNRSLRDHQSVVMGRINKPLRGIISTPAEDLCHYLLYMVNCLPKANPKLG